ncbi:DUF6325 family protein [Amnibacterium sp.]|uniref:DUF6325 family protein n=1 Tax=Amnibacterium sp. TaxID=1872496 RepID=UPI003F7C7BDD
MTDVGVGPIDYLALRFPHARFTGDGLRAIVDLVDRGIIRVLDLRFAKRGTDGTVRGAALADLDGDGLLDLALFDGVESGLLDDDDLEEFGDLIAPGDAVGIVIYENTWAVPFVTAMAAAGAEVVSSARIPALDVAARLDEIEDRPASARVPA